MKTPAILLLLFLFMMSLAQSDEEQSGKEPPEKDDVLVILVGFCQCYHVRNACMPTFGTSSFSFPVFYVLIFRQKTIRHY